MRLAALAFCELAEASATLARLGEARSERSARAYLEVVRDAVAATGGRELARGEDGALVAFESATAAVTFAGLVQRGCGREGRRSGEPLDVRIGIDVGELPPEGAAQAGVAASARLLARAAEAGSVLSTGVVAALARTEEARFSPAGLVELPGEAAPVAVVEVSWERQPSEQTPLPAEVESGGFRTSFVGRTAERQRLAAAWERALGGERQLAFVVGEPGIGKTRLVVEFARELHEQGAVVLWGRSFEEALTPYQPFVQALLHYVRFTPPAELREQVGARAPVLARLLPELEVSLQARAPSGEEAIGERYRLFGAIGELLAAAGAERPLLLVLDDLQWADEATLLLLKHLARDPAPVPLLLLGTYRQSEVGRDHPLALALADVERDRIVERVGLTGLGEGEVGELVSDLIGWQPPAEVVDGLRAETEGNPFFLEETVRHLVELGLGADAERLAGVQATVRELGVPARVRELVGRRVQRLAPATRKVVSSGAVIGSEFDRDVLAAAIDAATSSELGAALDEAVEAGLLLESPERVGRYGFSHALIQQALYEDQTRNGRAALHGRVAGALERLRLGETAPHAELAYHYSCAGEEHAGKVVLHGRAAGEHALRVLAYEDAVRELSVALAALDRVEGEDLIGRAELLTLLGTGLSRAGDWEEGRAAFAEAVELSARAGAWETIATAALGYGGGTHFGGVWETLFAVDQELVRLLELALAACPEGESRARVRLLGRLAQALYWLPTGEESLRLSAEALAMARSLRDTVALAYALDARIVALWGPDHLDERRPLAEEMLTLGLDLGDQEIELEALCWLIVGALERGSISEVDDLIGEHARIAARLRQPYDLWFTETLRVMRAHLEGRFDEASELCERAYAHGVRAQQANAVQVHLMQLLLLRLDQGRAGELVDELGRASLLPSAPAWGAATALALAGLDRREEALALVATLAEGGFASIPRNAVWMTTLVCAAGAVGHFDDPVHADELYELLLPFADRICVPVGPVLCLGPVSRILGMLARAAGRPDEALGHYAHALERSRELGSPPLVARIRLGAAKAHLLRGAEGDATAAMRLLEQAAAAAAELGMAELGREIDLLRSSIATGALA
jgi:tetratricopeptide (TPR) repeat protein